MRLNDMSRLGVSLVGFVVAVLLFGGCGSDDELIGIQMPYRYQFDVPAGLNPLNTHFFERSGLITNASLLLGNNEINRIIPYTARLTSLDNVDFGFIREIEVRVKDPDNPGLEIPVFYREELPQNTGRNIDLIATQANITDILNKPSIDVIVEFRLYSSTGQSFQTDLQLSFLAQ